MQETILWVDYCKDLIVKQKRWIILGTLISTLTAAVVATFLPDIYYASAVVYLDNAKTKTMVEPPDIIVSNGADEQILPIKTLLDSFFISAKTAEVILMSEDMIKSVADALGIKDMTVQDLKKKNLRVEREIEQKTPYNIFYAPVLTLTVTLKKDKRLTADIANKWGELFIEKYNMINNRRNEEAYGFMKKQAEISKTNLEKAQEDFYKFAYSRQYKEDPIRRKIEYQNLKRAVKSARTAYEVFDIKVTDTKIALEERRAMAYVYANAVEPERHIGPPRILISLCAAFLGFISSIFFLLFSRYSPKDR